MAERVAVEIDVHALAFMRGQLNFGEAFSSRSGWSTPPCGARTYNWATVEPAISESLVTTKSTPVAVAVIALYVNVE